MDPVEDKQTPALPGFLSRILLAAGVAVLIFTAYRLAMVFVIAFGGIIVAIMLDNIANPLSRRLRIPHHPALALTAAGLVLLVIAFLSTFGAQAAAQFNQLALRMPQAWADTRFWLDSGPAGRWILSLIDSASGEAGSTLVSAISFAGGVFDGIANFALILVVGVYLAADAELYVKGALRLLPPDKRERAREIMDAASADLRKWLMAMTLDMLFLGTITGVGLYLVGAPFPQIGRAHV